MRSATWAIFVAAAIGCPWTALAVYQCGDQKDDCQCGMDNPFYCCDNGGNCTWWAWEQACCNWGVAIPTLGNAWHWKNELSAAGYPWSKDPVVGSIFVRTVGGGFCEDDNHDCGHVGWVVSAKSDGSFCATEMGCWGWYGVKTNCHSPGYADGGFFCKKGTQCGGTPPDQCNTKVGPGETIIDDLDPCFERHGTPNYWWEASIGYAGHMWYTYASDDPVDNYGVWRLNVSEAGDYEVFAYVPENNATTHQAKYVIHHDGKDDSKVVNQNDLYAVFTSLGTYHFAAGGGQWVRLDDSTGEDYNTYKRKVGFDAIKLVKKQSCTPDVSKQCSGGDVYWYDSCGNKGGIAEKCDDGKACTTDSCANGQCQHQVASHASRQCSDGDAWWFDACGNKEDKAEECDDGKACTTDSCANGSCQHVAMPHDHEACVGNDLWWHDSCDNPEGLSQSCDDGNPCTDDTCQGSACYHKPNTAPCDDSDPCTETDRCQSGACVGVPIQCPSDLCNDGVCQAGMCVKVPRAGECDDGNACTISDHCEAGVCVPGTLVNCDDQDPCTMDGCDPVTGCAHVDVCGDAVEDLTQVDEAEDLTQVDDGGLTQVDEAVAEGLTQADADVTKTEPGVEAADSPALRMDARAPDVAKAGPSGGGCSPSSHAGIGPALLVFAFFMFVRRRAL